ncbi:MAG TPA: exodeoxyribonuclease III [Anaerolineaceae bacterium]|nr:exodeoxyribonuclease III [Anaerolineaceae bacterium]
MKITTWNVNGIRAALSKGLWAWIKAQEPDVLCLQEVKARLDQLPEDQRNPDGYLGFWNSAERPGYSGVATFTRQMPIEVRNGLGIEKFDVEGRVIRKRYPDFWLYNIYFPNGQRGQGRVDYKLEFYACLLEEADRLHAAGEQLIITGDFNTAHREIDLANPRQNATTSGFLPEERVWIDYYLQHGFVDAYRQLYPEKVEYTWWTYRMNARQRNVGWRLDYFLVSEGLMERVSDVVVHGDAMGSDHCPVSLILR